MEKYLLMIHLLGAMYLGGYILYALMQVFQDNSEMIGKSIQSIAASSTFQIITGSILALLSSNYSFTQYCRNIGIYIVVVTAVELLLVLKLKTSSDERLPYRHILTTGFMSILVMLFTVSHLS